MNRLLVATKNPGKVRELVELLGPSPVEIVGLDLFPDIPEPEETGASFAENAAIKAVGYARATGLPAVADDSGLEVAALGGRPGVLSARYGGQDRDYPAKMALLLDELRRAGGRDRSARFVCSMALATPEGEIVFTCDGICEGRIADAPRGDGGFGFDPIFVPEGYDETFAQLSPEVKSRISHRARAAQLFMQYLPDFIGV